VTHPLLAGLNPEQARAASTTKGPLLVLAGAGSGKTRVLTHRLAYLIHEAGVRPGNILAVTFTNKAAGEMRERVRHMVGEEARWLRLSTFHSFCVYVLRRDIHHLGWSPRFTIYDVADQKQLIKRLMKATGVDGSKFRPARVLRAIDQAKNRMIAPEDYDTHFPSAPGDPTAKLYPLYEQQLRKLDAVDFNDLINLTVRLWTQHPAVLAAWRRRYQHILVDEYQDTNQAQFQLIQLLGGQHGNVMVVGDDDQSIYAFRGADIRNILDFGETFPDPTVVRLEQNYRSTGNILKAAHAVVSNNRGRMDKKLWTDAGDGAKLQMLVGQDEREQAHLVVDRIRSLRREGLRYRDIAIIYRTNASSRAFEERLVRADIPHVLVGSVKFYERREVRDLVAYLKLVLNPADDVAFERVINSPRRGIGAKGLDDLRRLAAARGVPLLEAAEEWGQGKGRGRKGAREFVSIIAGLRKALDTMAPGALVERAVADTGYRAALEAEGTDEAAARLENLEELARAVGDPDLELDPDEADAADADPRMRLQLFLDKASLASQADELPGDDEEGRVTLLTAHLAKGLEFPAVFVVGLHQGGFPHFMAMNNEDELEEERRLVYVAFTRAMKQLILCRPRRRFNPHSRQFEDAGPSRFLEEIPAELIDWGRARSRSTDDRAARAERLGFGGPSPFARPGRRAAPAPAPRPSLPTGTIRTRTPEGLEDLTKGTRVLHKNFGLGEIRAVSGSPSNPKIGVAFDSGVSKQLLARFAGLEVVDE